MLKLNYLFLMTVILFSQAAAAEPLPNLDMKNARQPTPQLITGGQVSEGDLIKLKKMGVTRIINLRGAGEFDGFDEASKVKALGMDYVSLPIEGVSGINLDNAKKLDQLLQDDQKKVVVHCASGNRVGALLALREYFIKGKSRSEALAFGEKAGLTRLKRAVEQVIDDAEKEAR